MNPASDSFQRQVALLAKTLPQIAKEPDFALGGGTALNFFLLDLPRLSVDAELTYLPVAVRSASLAAIHDAMLRIAHRIQAFNRGILINYGEVMPDRKITKLLIREENAQITIEADALRRGSVLPPQLLPLSPAAAAEYAHSVPSTEPLAGMKVLSSADLYARIMVDTLERQMPQSFFDLQSLFDRDGQEAKAVDLPLRSAFLVYLLSSTRPLAELLVPLRAAFRDDLLGSLERLSRHAGGVAPSLLNSLLKTREQFIRSMIYEMPEAHRRFLLSFESGEADWSLLDLAAAQHLPAIRARQQHLASLPHATIAALRSHLEGILLPGPMLQQSTA